MAAEVAEEPRLYLPVRPRRAAHARRVAIAALWLFTLGNAAALVWLWYHGGNVTRVHTTGELLTSIGRITGLLGAYLALLQVVLLSRLPALERLAGFDRLSIWHRWNGHACLYLILAHVGFSVVGYEKMDRFRLWKEISTMIWGGVYPGMITATVGTFLFVVVVISSIVIVRRRLRYETWHVVHLAAYAAIALGWFHQIPTGNELVVDPVAADYWRSLYVATLAVLVVFRFAAPIANTLRFGLRVEDVVVEGPGVVSLRIAGRRLERLRARPGQFFIWRFLTRRDWWRAHPFSLSAAPDGGALRITVKGLGDFTGRLGQMPVGTRVVAEGPLGVFTDASRTREKVLLIAGGIGITPIRALLEEMEGDRVVVYRVLTADDVIFREELSKLAETRGFELHVVVGDHATREGRSLLSPEHLRTLVPDIGEREVYLCGPPAMTAAIERNLRHTAVPRKYVHIERFAL
jgi:predicted ferric reductase